MRVKIARGKELCFSLFIIVLAVICIVLCVRHYGMGVQPYYEEQLEIVPDIQEVYRLEDGTVVEQLYHNSASYMSGIDLLLIGTGEGCEGTLYVQLCDPEGNVLVQKCEELQKIEPGQFYPVRFADSINVCNYEKLAVRIFAGESSEVPELLAIAPSEDVEDSIGCTVDGQPVENNLAIAYLYGKWQYIGKFKGNGTKEALVASAGLIFLISFAMIFTFCYRERINAKAFIAACRREKDQKQILSILWFFCIFFGASIVSRIRSGKTVPSGVYLYIIFVIGITGYYFYKRRRGHDKQRENLFSGIMQDKGLIAVLLASTLIRIPMFVHIQLVDGSVYYGVLQRVCSHFEYSLAYIWDHFRLCGHYAIVYTFFAAVGEFLFPGEVTGVLLITLILTDCALFCIYKMLRGYWLNLSQREAAVGTMLVSLCPLFLGLFSNISLEALLVVFTIFLFYADYREQKIMKMVWLIAIVMTKETGLVIVGGYLAAHICVHLWTTIKNKKGDIIYSFFADYNVICAILGMILFFLYTIGQRGLFVWFGMSQRSGSNLFTDFIDSLSGGFPFLLQKLKMLFVLHFEWIPVLVILCCILCRVIRREKWVSFPGQTGFWGALGGFIAFNLCFFRYQLGRYHIFSAAMIWLLAYILLCKTYGKRLDNPAGLGICSGLLILLVVQNFYYIDPFTNLVFERYNTGKGRMISTEINGGNFGDTFVNNFRYTYLYDLVDRMLKESEFDENTQVVIPFERDYLVLDEYVGYDKERKRRVFCEAPDGEKVIGIGQVLLEDVLGENQEELPERGVIYFMPYIECDEQEALRSAGQYYDISERREISNWGGTLIYYIMEKKQ